MRINKKALAVSTATLTIVGGVAYAYIQTTGTGSGSVTASTILPVATLSVSTPISGDLQDDAGVTLPVVATNTYGSTLHFTPALPTVTINGANGGTCPVTDFTTSWVSTPGTITVGPNVTSANAVTVGSVNVKPTDPANTQLPTPCTGATVDLNWP